MSRARRIGDAERTAIMLDLLRREYPGENAMSLSHVVIEEVAPGTGWAARRWADVLALSVWPSNGLTLDGFEVKASRADLKKELSDLSKHQAVARYCDTWTLVAWDESVLADGIPDSWGILLTIENSGERELKTHRKATKRAPEPWPREFVCSIVRNAYMQAPGAAYLARACAEASKRGYREGKNIAQSEAEHAIRPLFEVLYGRESWRWPSRDIAAVAREAAERITQLPLVNAT